MDFSKLYGSLSEIQTKIIFFISFSLLFFACKEIVALFIFMVYIYFVHYLKPKLCIAWKLNLLESSLTI